MQREFRKLAVALACAALAATVLIAAYGIDRLPDRIELGRRELPLRYERISLDRGKVGPFRIVGAWKLHADDPRFGGFSGLVVDGGLLTALSDSGVVARFPKPGMPRSLAVVDELPDGPADPGFKHNRDSEALVADPAGNGWWVAFEIRHQLWLYDRDFGRAIERRSIDRAWVRGNRGIEAMVAERGQLLLFPERGGRAVRLDGAQASIRGQSGWISDAVRLNSGRVLVANRTPTPIGLSNRLALLERHETGYVQQASWRIPVDRLSNVEALALDARPDGALRLWMMTDNNLQQRRPTLLIALELRRRPAR